LGGGGEQHPVPGLAGPDRQPGRQVGLAGAWWAEEHDVVAGGDEVQGSQVGEGVAFEPAGVVEVELLEALAGGKAGGADASFAAVGLPGGDLALQTRHQELLVAPRLGAGPSGQARHRFAQRGGFERPGQKRHLAGQVPSGGLGRGGHQATPP
jgi:hypothetical protein